MKKSLNISWDVTLLNYARIIRNNFSFIYFGEIPRHICTAGISIAYNLWPINIVSPVKCKLHCSIAATNTKVTTLYSRVSLTTSRCAGVTYSFFSLLIFPPGKNEYILVFPPERSVYTHFFPRKDQYILIFPPDF